MISTDLQTFGPASIMRRFTIPYTDLTDADGSQTFDLMTLPKGSIVKGVRIKQSTLFTNGAGCTATCAVGATAGAVDTFAPAYSIAAAVADTTAQMTSGWKAATYAADTLTATIASNVNVNTMTSGQVNIDVEIWLEPDLTATGPCGNSLTAGGLV
jgi:hypothetical protein